MGVPYVKDPVTGCISYRAKDVLEYLERGKRCISTAQYDTTSHSKRLERARAVLVNPATVKGRPQMNEQEKFHPIASIFPMMSEQEFQAHKEDIKVNGQIEPIWLYQNKIIDGRHRVSGVR